MNKTLYNIIGHTPIIGSMLRSKTNFFAFKCSPFMADFVGTAEHKVLTDWLKAHPDQVVSPKMAKKIISNMKK